LAGLLLLRTHEYIWGEVMLSIHVDQVGDVAVVEFEGRIVRSEAVFELRDAVLSQAAARIVVLDLSEVDAIGGAGLGMLVFLQRWAYAHNIRLKLFNPRRSVQDRLEGAVTIPAFEIATLDEMISLLARPDTRYALAS
jgi:anti-anti-sigma factor